VKTLAISDWRLLILRLPDDRFGKARAIEEILTVV
jgi:hypothetical protein